MLACDYLISLAYFATFRVNSEWRSGGAFLKQFDESDASSHSLIYKFQSNLELICKSELDDLHYDLRLLKDMLCAVYLGQAKRELTDDGEDAPTDAQAYAYWMREKFEAEKLASTTTEELSWFTETDRIVKSLLDQTPEPASGCVHGRMVIMRVFENDENLSMQKILRTALDLLDLGRLDDSRASPASSGKQKKRAFSVICDIATTRLYAHIEESFLDHDLRRPGNRLCADDEPQLVDSKGKPVERFTLRSIFESRLKDPRMRKGKVSVSGAELRYEDLHNLPCLVILCDKGRMGDTFPHSLNSLDFRLRTAGFYTAFLQELGRMCRYPATRMLKEGDQDASFAVKDSRGGENTKELERQVRMALNMQTAPNPAEPFSFPLLVRCDGTDRKVAGVACNFIQLQNIINTQLEIQQYYLIEIYLDKLPQALVRTEIHGKLVEAINWKQQHVPNDPCITAADCIAMPNGLDPYMTCDGGMKQLRELPKSTGKVNPMHDYVQYSPSGGSQSQKPHYDFNNKPPGKLHERRVVLFAECQIGKTGAYLHLLSSLREEIQAGHFPFESLEPLITKSTWHFPCAPTASSFHCHALSHSRVSLSRAHSQTGKIS
jgi:hypothetical protein